MSYLGQQLGQGQAERFVYTATGGETSVTNDDAGRAIAYTVGQVDVYLNGAKLINGSDFTATTGTSITGLAALTASDVVEVFALSIFQASDTVSASTGGTFNGNVTVDANLTVTGTADIDTSLNVDGTVTADGLTVERSGQAAALFQGYSSVTSVNAVSNGEILLGSNASFQGRISYDGQSIGALYIENTYNNDAADIIFRSKSAGTAQNKLLIEGNGDISFYEDTGTTPKFFWDASEEKLGLGSTSFAGYGPLQLGSTSATSSNSTLQFLASSASASYIQFGDTTAADAGRYSGYIGYLHSTDAMRFATSATERMRIDSSGVLNIKNTGSTADFISETATSFIVGDGSGTQAMTVYSGTANNGALYFADGSTGSATYRGGVQYLHGSDAMRFFTSSAERMRITSGGELLVGTTVANTYASAVASGVHLDSSGFISGARSGDVCGVFNRQTSDGDIVLFRKDGTTVGSIGESSGLYIERSAGAGWQFGVGNISPRKSGALADNQVDLGSTSYRYKDLYLSGGVYLGGTGAANHLDDYEEGTWTPTITGDSGASGQTYTTQKGHYVKVGRQVTAWFSVDLSNKGTLSGINLVIAGLPFTIENDAGVGQGVIVYWDNLTASVSSMMLNNRQNTTQAYINHAVGAGNTITQNNTTIIGTSTRLDGMFTYREA